ncbi:hypothetical protein, partial [Burkholderia multivorans]|uniref:hypothetical protein n=1 Tax=Burkholderia multivorans TaxID=87883 RepID=UPI001C65A613
SYRQSRLFNEKLVENQEFVGPFAVKKFGAQIGEGLPLRVRWTRCGNAERIQEVPIIPFCFSDNDRVHNIEPGIVN